MRSEAEGQDHRAPELGAAKKLKDNLNLVQKADDDTVRRAIVRELTEAFKELDAMEQGASVAREEEEPQPAGRGLPLRSEPRGRAPKTRGVATPNH